MKGKKGGRKEGRKEGREEERMERKDGKEGSYGNEDKWKKMYDIFSH